MQEHFFRLLRAGGLAGFLPLAAVAAPPPSDNSQYPTRAAAEDHCPGEVIVWVDLDARVYYFRGQDRYGSTKRGAYMCQRDVKSGGYRQNRSGR
ncbi:hypothetical protein GCM10011611_35530 [Aliidongia dinghuensis]|uniref:Secreted protein n=1 Tax=Aliidongia dinghuensis TaxID=1867774 RepID=A0A8J2YV22_9PROT|nr:hypothetical protein [Aliidongia dinghuensis]GGF26368.1 hypothetical protein GCM10011611_35530 [Aliidongia dinghuensis]